jgi:hypothetical protein
MKRILFAFALLVPAAMLIAAEGVKEKKTEQVVLVPEDSKPFKVEQDQLVRLPGKGIAGATVEADVQGPATVLVTNVIMKVKDGNHLMGALDKEFIVKPSGKGAVKVKITSTPPQPNAKPTVTNYEFEVK